MITAVHTLVYSDDATATRAFFKDVLQWPFVSEGERGDEGIGGRGTGDVDPAGWLIFGTGPSELGVHPTRSEWEGSTYESPRHHAISLMCDDIEATRSELEAKGATFSAPVTDQGYGLVTMLDVPGADAIQLYQPRHTTAYGL